MNDYTYTSDINRRRARRGIGFDEFRGTTLEHAENLLARALRSFEGDFEDEE